MKFSCPSCSAKYQIADEKVEGRTVKMKCRKCGTVIPIRANPSKKSLAAAPVVQAQSLKPRVAPAPTGLRAARIPKIDAPAPPSIPTQPPPAEWHAGIGGSAIGPLTFHDLERRIMDGDITSDTFIWREGMDGWKQVPDVPEVAPLLESIVMAGPPSMPAVAKSQVVEPAKPVPAKPVPAKPVPAPKPAAKPPAAEKSPLLTPSAGGGGSIPLAGLTASNPLISEAGAPAPIPSLQAPADEAPSIPAPGSFDDDFDFPGENPDENQAQDAAKEETAPASEQHAMGKAPAAPSAATVAALKGTSSTPPADEAPVPEISATDGPYVASHEPSYDSLVMQLHKRRSNKWAIPFTVIMAIGLGLAVGFVVFGDQETKIIRQIVEVPAQLKEAREHRQAASADAESDSSAAAGQAEDATEAPSKGTSKSASAKSPSGAKSAESSEEAAKVSAGLKGLSGLQGLGGPTGGPTANNGSSAGGRPLESGQIQRVVSQYQTSVKRGCWQPALMTRDKDAPSSARVSVAITVSSTGAVTKASTSGDPKGYSGLSSCISRKVRGWQFPRSSGTTTVNVPFVFAAQ